MSSRLLKTCTRACPKFARRALAMALFTAVLPALRAQFLFPPQTNLFGDEIVVKVPKDAREARAAALKLAEASAVPGLRQTLLFQNGSQLRGEIVSLSGGEIAWKHPAAAEPLRFRLQEVKR